jgi:C4-dicarboxylate transporter, DctM subunit
MTSPSASATLPVPAARLRGNLRRAIAAAEELVAGAALAAILCLLLTETILRPWLGFAIPGSLQMIRQLTLWVALLGAALAARDGRLLALATGTFIPEGRARAVAEALAIAVAVAVTTILCAGSVALVQGEFAYRTSAARVPVWLSQTVLPVGFLLIGVRLVLQLGSRAGRAVATTGAAIGLALATWPDAIASQPAWPWIVVLAAAGMIGTPLFAVLGGLATVLFMTHGTPPVAVLSAAYELATHPTLAALPVFTLAGFVLAEGDTARRLLRIFRAWLGWLPGGTAVVCALVCAFFTVFTGGSGVTILALGGLLLPALLDDGYEDGFSVGLLTGSSSLGLLLPPALPLILYSIVAQIPLADLFLGGVMPGVLMIGLVTTYAMNVARRRAMPRISFDAREGVAALWHGKWEVLLPIVVLGVFFGGYATILETSALAAVYALVVQVFIHRNLRSGESLRRVFSATVATIGGVLIILVVAYGLTSYLIDADVPATITAWTRQHVHSPLMFLLMLNLFLLGVGCVMDMFSAILVVAPLVLPLGAAFGVHPVHLGIIFVANLELGYITPPVGLNLFLASQRFDRPLLGVCRASLPMLVILGLAVLLITYLPWLTTAWLTP